MTTTIGQIADTPTTVVRLYPYGAIPVNVAQNILGVIGTAAGGPAMTVQAFTSSQEVTNTYEAGPLARAGQLAFFNSLQDGYFVRVLGSGYATASYQLKDSVVGQGNAGVLTALSSGSRGNSLRAVIEDGTFHAHDTEYFVGDGTVGPYYLLYDDLVGPWPVASDRNWVKVDNVAKTIVYDVGSLGAGKVYVDTANGALTFYVSEEPTAYSYITVDIAYKTRKITLYDGSTVYPAVDVLGDTVAIEAAFKDSTPVTYNADATNTHMPAIGTYKLAGGSDGAAITVNDWDDAIWVLRDYLSEVRTGITAITLTQASVAGSPGTGDGSYDLLSLLEGHIAEMEQDWEPCLGIIGMDQNEDTSTAIRIVSSHAHRNLMVIANPWGGEQDPPRTCGWVALAAREAQISLGDDTAERSSLNAILGMQGLLTIYRKATIRGLQNNRLCVLIKEDGIYPNWSRTVGVDWQFVDAVDNRTINYVLRMLIAISKRFYFKKNIPDIRSDFKRSIAIELNRLLAKYIAVKYILEVSGPGDRGYRYTDNGRVDVNLVIENVGHIKRIIIDYGVGIIEDGSNVVYAPNIYSQEG